MKSLVLFLILIALPGCAAQQIDHVLTNLDKDCERHYMGTIGGLGGMGATASFQIDCKPSGTTTTTTITVVPPNPAAPSGGQ